MTLLVFGHKNPDTDSICSAVSLAYLKNKLGQNAKAYALGEVRKEAKYVLDYFKVDAPTVLTSISNSPLQLRPSLPIPVANFK